MKIVDGLLDAKGCETFVALTYGCDLAWFERMLARPLRAQGVRRFVLLTDYSQLSLSLESQLDLIRGAGRWYSVEGIKAGGSFHPKLYMLTGPDRARLWIGSGNLRVTGLGRNREVFEQWEARTDDGATPSIFEDVRLYIDRVLARLLGRVPQHVTDALTEAFGVRVLAQPVASVPGSLLGSPGALSTQLPAVASPAKRLRLVAPFFDEGGKAVTYLADHFQATEFDVITDVAVTTLGPAAISAIRKRGGRILSTPDLRPLHAKLAHAEADDWAVSIHGSANLTNSAWHGANAELVVLNQGPSAAEVGTLIDGLEVTPLSASDEQLLELRASRRPAKELPETGEMLGIGIESARWLDDHAISIVTRSETTVTVDCRSNRDVITVTPTRTSPGVLQIAAPKSLSKELPMAVRLRAGDAVGAWVVVHHAAELAEWAKSTSKNEQRLMPLLLANPDDADLAWLYADVCRRVLLDRAEREVEEGGEGESAGARTRAQPKWTFVRDEDFSDGRRRDESDGISTEMVDPARLLRRVLFSSDDDDDGVHGIDTEQEGQGEQAGESAPSTKKVLTREQQREFTTVIETMRVEYLAGLRKKTKRGAEQLLEDLQLLMIGAHRGVRIGALTPRAFLATAVPTLREFIGSRGRAFTLALRSATELVADKTWGAWCWATVCLLTYNACLAQQELNPPEAEDAPDPAFIDAAPVLWLRNLVSALDLNVEPATLDLLGRQVPRLRRLGLWLGDVWPYTSARVPFEQFVRRMITDAIAIERANRALPSPVPRLSASDEDVHVVGRGRDGQISVGFQEGPFAYLRDGAFQRAEADEAPWETMHKTNQACPLDALLGEAVDEVLFQGLDVLRELV